MDETEARERIQKLLVTGDNRLKQRVSHGKVRETYEQALVLARETGLEPSVRPLIELRLADLDRLETDRDKDESAHVRRRGGRLTAKRSRPLGPDP